MASNKPKHLDPSELGTKEYWDALYNTEISNHASDTSDLGTVWFADSDAENKVLSFLEEQILEDKVLGDSIGLENCSFLDLGTGNGHFLLRLRGISDDASNEDEDEETVKWHGRMMGVDYSERSVEFAKRIAAGRDTEIEFRRWDIMYDGPTAIIDRAQAIGWDVVLDKGTFDAISLSEEKDEHGRRLCEGYKDRVVPLVREDGLFLVTSCNWTGQELKEWFEGESMKVVGEVAYRSFSFGGVKGQSVSSVCFRKRTEGS